MAVWAQKESWQPTGENFLHYRNYRVTDYGAFVYGIARLYDLCEQPPQIQISPSQLVENTAGIRRFTTEVIDWDKTVLPVVVKDFLLEDETVRASNQLDVSVHGFALPRREPVVKNARTIWEYSNKVKTDQIEGFTDIGEDMEHTIFITPHVDPSRVFDLTIRRGFDYGDFLGSMTPNHDMFVGNFSLSGRFILLNKDGTVTGHGYQDPRNFQVDIEGTPSPEHVLTGLRIVQFALAERERKLPSGILLSK